MTKANGVYIGMSTGNAYFAGTLYANKGNIGGWTINKSALMKSANIKLEGKDAYTGYTVFRAPAEAKEGTTAIAIGSSSTDSFTDAPFRVDYAGRLKATGATISGNITANSLMLGDNAQVDDGLVQTGDLEISKE
jgi:hypothetical protein